MVELVIQPEPRDEQYQTLLRVASGYCDEFAFVLTGMELEPEGKDVIRSLAPFLIDRSEVNSYPGGDLPWGTVTRMRYRLTDDALDVLARATTRLYGWQEPDLPNDLYFTRGGSPFLITMADERVGIVEVGDHELADLRAALPLLQFKPIAVRTEQDDRPT